MVGRRGNVGVVHSVVEDCECYGVHGVDSECGVSGCGGEGGGDVGYHVCGGEGGGGGCGVRDFKFVFVGVAVEDCGDCCVETLDDLIWDWYVRL